jgi:SAM-dependent methyltransferase
LTLKQLRRRIKSKISISIRDYFFVLKHIPKRFKEYRQISNLFKGLSGLEIGGPSDLFFTKLYIYQNLKSLSVANFSNETTWEGKIGEGLNCRYYSNKLAYQYILDTTNLYKIKDNSYEAVLSSHSLEHVANPIKALFEWKRVLKKNGKILLILPYKINNFDNKRPYTLFSHILSDYENKITEDDMTHYEEIIKLHDLKHYSKDANYENFLEESKNNFKNRHFHQHVFNKDLIFKMLDFVGFNVEHYYEYKEDLITVAKLDK